MSQKAIWRSGTRRWNHPRVPDVQMGFSNSRRMRGYRDSVLNNGRQETLPMHQQRKRRVSNATNSAISEPYLLNPSTQNHGLLRKINHTNINVIMPPDVNSNRPKSHIPQCTCPTSHNAPLGTELCIFLFSMVHCGIWDRYIVGYVRLVNTGDCVVGQLS